MAIQPDYFTKYENLHFYRDENGILEVRMHTNGGSLVFTPALP
ncbi:MAG: hypothetical protein VKN72_17560 [Nostocales cyanobacterium 94392]|nr:hypothetical protein [Nostocales cyanobacterium 94392]